MTASKQAADAPETRVAHIVWWAWGVSLFGGLLFGYLQGHGATPALLGRMLSSLLLILAGVLAWRAATRSPAGGIDAGYPLLITLGMGFGTLGDFFNAGLFGPDLTTLAAMGAFGVGHLFYISAALRQSQRLPGARLRKWLPVLLWLALAVLGWWLIVYRASVAPGLAPLVWPALGYTLLLAITAGVGTALGLLDRRFLTLAAGSALFLLSDLILGVEIFRGRFPQDTLAVWIPYGCGQMLIVFSAARYVSEVRT